MNYKAFCNELEREVTIYEVWELLNGKALFNKTLTFKCVDPDCGAQLIVRNCFGHRRPSDASFRLKSLERHTIKCTYIRQLRAEKKQEKLSNSNFNFMYMY